MAKLERILAATDLSAPARHAVARAYHIVGATGAELTLLHVINQGTLERLHSMLGGGAKRVEQHLLDASREALGHLADELGQTHGVSASLRLVTGRVLAAILDEADALDADLIVVGARGEGFLGRLLIGTTSERLLRRTLRPMLVVKQAPYQTYRRVLVPVDFSPCSAEILRLAQAAAPGAELILLHAFEAPFESKLRYAGVEEETLKRYLATTRTDALSKLQALAANAQDDVAHVHLHVQHGEPARLILAQERELDCDLIVLGKHGQGMLEELLLGSVTKHVLAESVSDVLVVVNPPR
ncbi:MAG: universal stress protein [Halothiobacillaceae bacterium]